MQYRKLRIAWSVAWGILCLLLLVPWVQSYQWRHEVFGIPFPKSTLAIVSMKGTFELHTFPATANDMFGDRMDSFGDAMYGFSNVPSTVGPTGVRSLPSAIIPHWTTVILCTVFGAAPWVPTRFSLRTLLIAMTVVAAILGAVVCAVN
jgi:hypothetical protein